MQLNPDCVRAILLTVESETGISKVFEIDEEHYAQFPLLLDFEYNEIAYHILQCNYSEYFTDIAHRFDNSFMICDLTPKGHEFLANIRISTHWQEIKKIAEDSGSLSLKLIAQIAEKYHAVKSLHSQ